MELLSLEEFYLSVGLEHGKGKFDMLVLESEFQKQANPIASVMAYWFLRVCALGRRQGTPFQSINFVTALFSHL